MRLATNAFLHVNRLGYAMLRPVIFRSSAQTAHEHMITLLRRTDNAAMSTALSGLHKLAFLQQQVSVGGVTLAAPLILAAGLVKGDGFESEQAALAAVRTGRNIIPGWRALPRLVGLVEFGSFTRWPRLGNSGTIVWRDASTRSSQNRVGLKNPGASAAAEFLALHKSHLPQQFGINIAVSPGVTDREQERIEVLESLAMFVERGVFPAWFTLNLSCPNTDDDPSGNQTAEKTHSLCSAAVNYLKSAAQPVPLWVKIGPTLADYQYNVLMQVFAETDVRAVVATNTLPMPTPDDANTTAGIGGGRLHCRSIEVVRRLAEEKGKHAYTVDIIGCGGVLDGTTYREFIHSGAQAVQYWTALIYRGPLAAALILSEAEYAH